MRSKDKSRAALSEKRIFPAIDLQRSSTRREELLLSKQEQDFVYLMRRMYASGTTSEVTEQILSLLDKTETNEELVKAFSANIRGKFEKEGFTL